ncbi:MFS transporter [Conexibacter sp. S30A1]|uniref:MFS transporter n=1 Tax=Conexibacter sp. S30A1 TaxID=2937800 RepID=UPI00200D0160|nr:MFS transporter [Conexibacter sp. S30A1]
MLDLRPLRSPGFRHVALTAWVNELGNWVGEVALAILVYDRTGSPLATAAMFLTLRFLPSLLAPPLTTRVEPLPPRYVLAVLFSLEALIYVMIAAATAQHFSLPLVLALVAADGLLAITATALTRTVLATGLTRDGLLREGNALINLGAMVVIAGGPALAGVLAATNGTGTALRFDAATFVVAALIIVTARHLRIESDTDAGFAGRLRAGLQTLRTSPTVSRLVVAIALAIGLGSVALPIEVIFAKQTLHAGDLGYGLLLTAWGAGMVAGGLGFALAERRTLMAVLGTSALLEALGYGGLAAAPTLALACAFSFLGGIGNSAAWVAARTALQERIPLRRQAAVMAVVESAIQTAPALGFIAGGAVTALSSPRAAYAVSALGVAAVVAWFTLRPIDRVRISLDAAPADPDARAPSDPPEGLQEMAAPGRNDPTPSLPTG